MMDEFVCDFLTTHGLKDYIDTFKSKHLTYSYIIGPVPNPFQLMPETNVCLPTYLDVYKFHFNIYLKVALQILCCAFTYAFMIIKWLD